MDIITSTKNPVIRAAAELKHKKLRESAGAFLIEGIKMTEEALKAGARVKTLFISEKAFKAGAGLPPSLRSLENHWDCRIYLISENVLSRITDTETPQGMAAVVETGAGGMLLHPEEQGSLRSKHDDGIGIFLEALQDPGNVGTIIRTADAAGACCVYLDEACADLFNPKTLRSSMGSVFHVPCGRVTGKTVVAEIKENGSKVIAATPYGDSAYYDTDMTGSFLLMIGNESAGLSTASVDMADVTIRIPMPGQAESLNASAAAAVILFEAVRQRQERKSGAS